MVDRRFSTVTEQVAQVLRDGLRQGRWQGTMPGRIRLAAELGVNHKTVNAALQVLENEGILVSRGAGRERAITVSNARSSLSSLNIKLLLYEESDKHDENTLELRHRLEERGHKVEFAAKTLAEMKFDVNRVARMVNKIEADAWVIRAGPRPVLEWFAARPKPAFAMFGRQSNLPIASVATLKSPAMVKALQRLVDLGHRRIVMLAREERRKPTPGIFERRFLEELERMGIEVGRYNLPHWEDDRLSYHRCLDSLFRHTPPTALFLCESALFFATLQYLAEKGLSAPRDISLICTTHHPAFEWFEPEVSHIHVDTLRFIPRVVKWAENVANGKEDLRETLIRGEFVEGGMIGPVPVASQP